MATAPAAAQTAFGPMVIAACEQWLPAGQRIHDDDLALRFLPRSQQLIVRACRRPGLRRLLVRATEHRARGMWAGILCRKRYADDLASRCLQAGIDQFVFLGAGLDTRPYRLVVPAGARIVEIDLPANITYKRQRLAAVFGTVPVGVDLIAHDLEHDDLATALETAGLDVRRPAMFVWEAVTQYLTEDAVRRTLDALRHAAEGSHLIFTFVRQDYLDGTNDYGAAAARRDFVTKYRVWHYGLDPDRVGGLLRGYGWAEREQVGAEEYAARYVAPTGRDLPVSQIERFVHATKAAPADS